MPLLTKESVTGSVTAIGLISMLTYTACHPAVTLGVHWDRVWPIIPGAAVQQETGESDSLTFSNCSGADPTVTPYGHRVRVERIHGSSTIWQLHRNQLSLVVGADSMMRVDVRGIQHRLLLVGGKC